MVSTTYTKPSSVGQSHEKIKAIIEADKNLALSEIDVRPYLNLLVKMPEKHKRETISSTIDTLFESAHTKVTDDNTKLVLQNLRKLVS